jgi:hypothetical protein
MVLTSLVYKLGLIIKFIFNLLTNIVIYAFNLIKMILFVVNNFIIYPLKVIYNIIYYIRYTFELIFNLLEKYFTDTNQNKLIITAILLYILASIYLKNMLVNICRFIFIMISLYFCNKNRQLRNNKNKY